MRIVAGLSLIACLGVLVAAAPPAGAFGANEYLENLNSVYNRFDEKMRDYLITEYNAYIDIYPDSKGAPEAHLMLARTYREKGLKHDALAVYTRGMFLFPASAQRPSLAEEAGTILQREGDYSNQLGVLQRLLNAPADSTLAGRHHAYLDFLHRLPADKFHARLLAETALFTRLHPQDRRVEILQLWCALSYANIGQNREGVVSLEKLENLSPTGPLIPLSRFYRADILHRDMGEHQAAHGILNSIVDEYPTCENMPDVLNLRAEVRFENTKDPAGAVADYLTLARQHGKHPRAADGMMRAAEITNDKIKDYRVAIDYYNEFAKRYPADPRAPLAMEIAAKLWLDKLKQYDNAAAQYSMAAAAFPDATDYAVDLLINAAKVHEDKTKKYSKANEYYQIILAKYQGHKKAKDVQKKISENQEKTDG